MDSTLNNRLYTAEQSRELDRVAILNQFDGDSFILMQRAGQAVFDKILELYPEINNYCIFCGQGNNGGDGFVTASLAAEQGYAVTVYFIGDKDKLTKDARKAYDLYQNNKKSNLFINVNTNNYKEHFIANQADINNQNNSSLTRIYIDALLGTGLNKEPEGIYKEAIDYINLSNRTNIINKNSKIFSIDIPSGLIADTGGIYNIAVKADATITFIGIKQGLLTKDGPDYSGKLFFDSLGVEHDVYGQVNNSSWLINQSWVDNIIQKELSERNKNSYKHQFGHVVVIGGDNGMPGAITMAGLAALRVGSGLVTIITHEKHSAEINQHHPELMVTGVFGTDKIDTNNIEQEKIYKILNKANVIVLGPGLGQSLWSKYIFELTMDFIFNKSNILKSVVVDADGLNLLGRYSLKEKLLNIDDKLILTPHEGEAKRLLSDESDNRNIDIFNNRFKTAKLITDNYNAVTILKGAGSLVCAKANKIALCNKGNPGMASAGMGDVLSGMIAGIVAQGLNNYDASCLAVFLHATAGDIQVQKFGERGLIATDILLEVRKLLNRK